jgi:ribosomal protein L7Ae-like RNA K-turn-binding protein
VNPSAWERVSRLVGLGVRARTATVGVQQARVEAQKGKAVLALVADDASEHGKAKIVPLLRAKGIRTIGGVTAAALGGVAGKAATTVIVVTDTALAKGILEAAASGVSDG